jgi:hypothetical protein
MMITVLSEAVAAMRWTIHVVGGGASGSGVIVGRIFGIRLVATTARRWLLG